jgi:predicted dehydrogenase
VTARARQRIGLVGFGRLARDYYLPALRSLGLADSLAVAEPLPAAREASRRLLPRATVCEDADALLAQADLGALLVASPPSTHLPVWRAAAARGLPVFMEKPFPLPAEIAQLDRGDPAWERLMIDFNRRFWPPYRWLREQVRAQRVGRALRARLVLRVDSGAWSTVSDHRARSGEGGALYDLGSQILDLAAMVLDAAPVRLRAARVDEGRGRELVRIELIFPDGARAECELGYAAPTRESARIECGEGVLRLDDPNFVAHAERGSARLGCAARRGIDLAALGWRGAFRSRSMLRYTVRAALASFFDRVRDGGRFRPGFEDGLRVATWLAAAERSLAAGREEILEEP